MVIREVYSCNVKHVVVRQGCLLQPARFNIILERTVSDAMQKHKGNASKCIRTVTNRRYADDIDALVAEEQL